MDDDTNFAEWAGALLEWNSELRKVRFQCLCLDNSMTRMGGKTCQSLLWEVYLHYLHWFSGGSLAKIMKEIP